jgi:hypothetical protein
MLATVLGTFTDRRETLAALDPRLEPVEDLDLSDRPELWFDFAADTGDGFDATYAVAWTLAQERVDVEGHAAPLPAGSLLVLGGDEVYPVASDDEYRDRMIGPFRAALPWREAGATRDLVAVPGNHDWYDGLGAWARRFCQQRWVGAWRTHQRRSYAAVRLPHHWWIWAVDIALSGLVDQPQLEFFEAWPGVRPIWPAPTRPPPAWCSSRQSRRGSPPTWGRPRRCGSTLRSIASRRPSPDATASASPPC